MNDRFGKELKVGQLVLYVYNGCGGSVGMNKEYVVSFSPKMVRTSRDKDGVGSCISASSLVILEEV